MARLIIGIQPVREAIRVHGSSIERVLLVRSSGGGSSKDSRAIDGIALAAQACGVEVRRVDRGELDKMARGGSHQGAIAIAEDLAVYSVSDLLASNPALVVVLDRITDPQNFGAIIRSAVAFEADWILWPEHDSAPLSPATFRASAGAIEHARLCKVTSLTSALQAMRAEGISVIGLAGDASVRINEIALGNPTAIVVGAEGSGLRKGVRNCCDQMARLPTSPPFGVLNASVSAGIALYEVRRQHNAKFSMIQTLAE